MNLLQREREARGLTLSEVARRAQMRTTKLWKLEHLELRLKVEDVPRLARAIGCDPLALIPTEADQPPAPAPPEPAARCCALTCPMTGTCPLARSPTQVVEALGETDPVALTQRAQLLALRAKQLWRLSAALFEHAKPRGVLAELAPQATRPSPFPTRVRPPGNAAGHG